MPQRRQYPALDNTHGVFDLRFVARFSRPGGQDGDAVMLRHLVIRAIEIRLIAACPRDAGTWIIRHQQLGRAPEKLESMYVAVTNKNPRIIVKCSLAIEPYRRARLSGEKICLRVHELSDGVTG